MKVPREPGKPRYYYRYALRMTRLWMTVLFWT